MATLEQLAEGIRRAHEAGNVEHVRVLGNAYRQLQAQQGQPDVVELQGKVAPQASTGAVSSNIEDRTAPPRAEPDLWQKLLNSTGATVNGLVNGIPVLGPLAQNITDAAIGTGMQITGNGTMRDYVERQQKLRKGYAEAAPLANISGNFAGSVGAFGTAAKVPAFAEALGLAGGKLGQRVVNSALSSQAIYTGDQLARGGEGVETLGNGVPAAIGGAVPVLGSMLKGGGQAIADTVTRGTQRKLSAAATVGAPSSQDLKAVSRSLFKQVDDSGVTVNTEKFSQFVAGLVQRAKGERISPTLDPKATGAFQELIGALDDVQRSGTALTFSDLHTLRQIAQKSATSAEGRDAHFANMIVDGIDNFITSAGATTVRGKEAGNALLGAISTWGRAKRVGLIEEAIYKAQNQASGLENGLRIQFRQLLQNPKTRRLFNDAERRAIEDVVRGNSLSNLTKLLGKFGFGGGNSTNMLGGSIGASIGGAFGGIPGAMLATAAGSGARRISERMTGNAADLAAKVVATPNVPVAPQARNLLESGRVPLELLLRGGAAGAGP